MIQVLLRVLIVTFVAACLLYVSRFWPFDLWGRQSWLGQLGLRPGGNMLQRWLNGTPLAEFALLIWVCLCFVALSLTERLCQLVTPTGKDT